MKNARSRAAFRRAARVLPGGVNSPVRAFRAVGGTPVFIRRGRGPWLVDLDGNRHLDFVGSWGPLLLGHAPPAVVAAARRAAGTGSTFGAPTEPETELAEVLRSALPSLERVRLVSSGTEACLSALRVARAFAGRNGVVKFAGAYHGHADPFLVKAGSGSATLGVPDSPGVPRGTAADTHILPYNNPRAFLSWIRRNWRRTGAVIVEPVAGNMGLVPPAEGFLEVLRRETERRGIVLIWDEVITGFRVAWGGAQTLFGIRPDLTTLGKVIGGGYPLAAYGGRREIMAKVAPEGPVYQAGTLSGNAVAVAAGLAQLRILRRNVSLYRRLDRATERLAGGWREAAARAGRDLCINRFGSMMTAFFQKGPVTDWDSASRSDRAAYARFFHRMLEQGIYLPPAQFECLFVGAAHRPVHIDAAIAAAGKALA